MRPRRRRRGWVRLPKSTRLTWSDHVPRGVEVLGTDPRVRPDVPAVLREQPVEPVQGGTPVGSDVGLDLPAEPEQISPGERPGPSVPEPHGEGETQAAKATPARRTRKSAPKPQPQPEPEPEPEG